MTELAEGLPDSIGRRAGEDTQQPESKRRGTRISTVVNAVVIILIAIIAFLLLTSIVAQQGKSVMGFRSFIVLTGSMSPAFGAGSYVIVKERPAQDIAAGDIISYYVSDGKTVLTHRVVEVIPGDAPTFVTRGDANDANDENTVPASSVLGVVVLPIEKLGLFLLTLRNPIYLAVYAIVVALVIFAPELIRALRGGGREAAVADGVPAGNSASMSGDVPAGGHNEHIESNAAAAQCGVPVGYSASTSGGVPANYGASISGGVHANNSASTSDGAGVVGSIASMASAYRQPLGNSEEEGA